MVSKRGHQNVKEEIKNRYVQALILISLDWELEFHVHTNAFQIGEGATLAQNSISKFGQSIMYVTKLLNLVKRNYVAIEKETLAMVYVLHKLRH